MRFKLGPLDNEWFGVMSGLTGETFVLAIARRIFGN